MELSNVDGDEKVGGYLVTFQDGYPLIGSWLDVKIHKQGNLDNRRDTKSIDLSAFR